MTDDDFNDILNQADQMTQDQLSTQIAALTTLTADQVQAMAPTVDNMVQLLQFIQIVRSASDSNDKKARLISNIDAYANFVFAIAGIVVSAAVPPKA
jgi:hypothetical protein